MTVLQFANLILGELAGIRTGSLIKRELVEIAFFSKGMCSMLKEGRKRKEGCGCRRLRLMKSMKLVIPSRFNS